MNALVPIKSRHIEYNYEISPDDVTKMRYHLAIVDDENRRAKLSQLVRNLSEWGAIIPVREAFETKVGNSRYRVLFQSFDSDQKPGMLRIEELKRPFKRNKELYERNNPEGIIDYIISRFS